MHKLLEEIKDFNLRDYRHTPGISYLFDIYYFIKNRIKPKQAWLITDIYYDWCDKPELIEEVLYRCIVNYVEDENCFGVIDWSHHQTYKEAAAFIKDCYDWIKIRRPKLQKQIQEIIANGFSELELQDFLTTLNNNKKTYDEQYPGLKELEAELYNKDTEYLTNIIKYRSYLWT